jgi:hypothetical protein
MNQVTEVLATVFGFALIGAMAYEIKRRRKHLRELYNVLDAEDKHVVAELDGRFRAVAAVRRQIA